MIFQSLSRKHKNSISGLKLGRITLSISFLIDSMIVIEDNENDYQYFFDYGLQ
tara:strand:- start:2834 stop:2992 length:159 start_codon:yes stop_codon:yes gene_type:complete